MKTYLKLLIFYIIIFHSCNSNSGPDTSRSENSLPILQDLSNNNLDRNQKSEILAKAYKIASKVNDDSLKNEMYLQISYQYSKLQDSLLFLKTNKEARNLSIGIKDSSGIAATYWDLGLYFQSKNINDSAYYQYYQGQKIYEALKNNFNSARLLLNMAMVQKDVKDYTGSEISTIQAISLLKPLQKHKQLFSAYNNLGIVSNELEEFDRAIFYHKKALEYLEKTDITRLIPLSLNNIGVVYKNQGLYNFAISNYEEALNHDGLFQENPALYAMLLDNLAHAQLKNGNAEGLSKMFFEALEIRDSLKDYDGISINKLHLAEYFLYKKDSIKALEYGNEVRELSKSTNNYRDLLSSYLLLSRLEEDNSCRYMDSYIQLNDSLQKEERIIRNKFARIRFETDEYISETERLNQRVLQISVIGFSVLVIFVLLYIIKDQRSRNKFIKQKQYANKEIYNLLLAQQKNFEEGREKEKQHISRELHDGVLGKLFGVRLSLDSLNEEDTPDIKKKRFGYIEDIQKIAEEIRLISHRLNKTSIFEVDFKKVLEELIAQQNRGNITFQFICDDFINWKGIEDDIKLNVYRIIQEAINNIHKHSKATEVNVQFQKNENGLILKIEDNGKGIDLRQIPGGIGLQNMKTRAKNIGGKLEIISGKAHEAGTLVKLWVKL